MGESPVSPDDYPPVSPHWAGEAVPMLGGVTGTARRQSPKPEAGMPDQELDDHSETALGDHLPGDSAVATTIPGPAGEVP
jgi:hypothetical protein